MTHAVASCGRAVAPLYLQRIDPEEIITAVRIRRAPMMSAGAGLKLRPERWQERERRSALPLSLVKPSVRTGAAESAGGRPSR